MVAEAGDFPKLGKFENSLVKLENCSYDTSADALILLRKAFYNIDYSDNRGLNLQVSMFQRIKVFNKQGLAAGDFMLRIPKDVKVVKVKGVTGNYDEFKKEWHNQNFEEKNLIREDFNEYVDVLKVPMPGIREGSVYDIYLNLEYQGLSYIPTFWFQDFIPVESAEISFKYPDFLVYKPQFTGIKPQLLSTNNRINAITFKDGSTANYNEIEEIYKRDKVKSLHTFDYMPCPNDYLSAMNYELVKIDPSFGRTIYGAINWMEVAKTFEGVDGLGPYLDKGLPSIGITLLPAGGLAEDTLQFIKQVITQVRNNINWNGEYRLFPNHSIEKVIKTRLGSNAEINFITYLILKSAGLNAFLVTSTTAGFGKVNPSYPSLNAFNQLLNLVMIGEEEYWFNAASVNAGFGFLEPSHQGNLGLVLNGTRSFLVPIKQTRNRQTNLIIATLDEMGNINGTLMSVYEQSLGARMRSKISDSAEYYKKQEKVGYESIALEDYELANFSNPHESLIEKASFQLKQVAKKNDNKLVLKPLSFLHRPQLNAAEDARDVPIDFGYSRQHVNKITIQLPSNYKVAAMPKGSMQKTSDGVAEFKIMATYQENQIQLLVELKINRAIVEKENLGYYNLFVKAMNEALEQMLILEKP